MGEIYQREQNSHHRAVPWTDVVVVVASTQKEMGSPQIALTIVGGTGSLPIALPIVGWS